MKVASVFLSDLAIADIIEQADWYEIQSGSRLADRWETSVTTTLLRILDRPATGAKCSVQAEELRELRRMPVRGFPKHLIFYQHLNTRIVVLRIVHGARDLESLFIK